MSFEIEIRIPGLDRLADAIERYLDHLLPHPRIKGEIVYIVQDSQVPVNFQITIASAVDAKGQPVDPSTLKHVVTTSDPTIATAGPNSSAPSDGTQGTLTFLGLEGPFTLNDQIEDAAGNVIGALAANFTVTAGLPTAISGGAIVFPGLTEVPVAPVPGTP